MSAKSSLASIRLPVRVPGMTAAVVGAMNRRIWPPPFRN
jgi:hypothetical protein